MRIPALRLVDDESARDSALAVLRACVDNKYTPRGFEWPLIRSLLDTRYGRVADSGFLFGSVTALLLRWAVRGHVFVGRRWWLLPTYSGLVVREFALADAARKCHYADFMQLAAGIDSPLGEAARAELRSKGRDVDKPYPNLTNGAAKAAPFSQTKAKTKAAARSSWERNVAIMFPAISRVDQTNPGDARSGAVLGVVALMSRFVLLHSFCDVFGGTAIAERYGDSTRHDPPLLRDSAMDTLRAKRAAHICQAASWDKLQKKNSKSTEKMIATDVFVLRISTRFFDWTPIEVMRCDRGADASHIFALSVPARPADPFADVLARPAFQSWFALPQPTMSAVWWAAFLPVAS
jgi:hypothetical protein